MRSGVLGFDPGLGGGIAFIAPDQGAKCIPTPVLKGGGTGKSQVDIREILLFLSLECGGPQNIALAVVEKVGAVHGASSSAGFTFGASYGMLLGMLTTLQIPFELVTPQKWKSEILTGLGREKSHAIQYVKRRYPTLSLRTTPRCTKDNDGMAEAVCIAEYGWRNLYRDKQHGKESATGLDLQCDEAEETSGAGWACQSGQGLHPGNG